MIVRLAFLAALLCAVPAAAQEAAPGPSATPEQIATARAEADRILAAAGADDVFENISADQTPRVRHTASGMICSFFGSREIDKVLIFPDPTRGNDVGCSTADSSGAEVTFYATRYQPMPSEREVLRNAVDAIRNRFPSARVYEGGLSSAGVAGQIPPVGAAFVVSTNKGELFTMALVSHRGEWGFKARASGPLERAAEVSLLAQAGFMTMLTLQALPWN